MNIILFPLLFLFALPSFSQEELISLEDIGRDITSKIEVFSLDQENFNLKEIFAMDFHPSNLKEIKVGYINNYTFFRFKVAPGGKVGEKAILSFDHALSGEVQVYKKKASMLRTWGLRVRQWPIQGDLFLE